MDWASLPVSRLLCGQSLVLSGGVANDGSKIIDKVCLVKVPQLKRELGPCRSTARIYLFDHLMQTYRRIVHLGLTPTYSLKIR